MSKEKSAQDIQELFRRSKSAIGNAGNSIADWYSGISPEARKTIIRALIGGAVGGGAAGLASAGTPRDREYRGSSISPALLGALLGGGAAAGFPLGAKLLKGSIRLPGEPRKPIISSGIESLLSPFASNPAATAGGGLGALALYKGLDPAKTPIQKAFRSGMGNVKQNPAGKFRGLLRGAKGAWKGTKLVPGGGKAQLMAVPAGLAVGALIDKYLKGDY